MIVSSGHGKIGFDAGGGSVLRKSDMAFWMNQPERTDRRGICFELSEEVQEVEQGFFQLVPTICELRILGPKSTIFLSEEDAELFRRNDVLIRGAFGSAAERFAKEYRLRFLHADTVLARSGDYFERGIDTITLCFYHDGSAYINQDCKCPGISAGNVGGGEDDIALPDDFYMTMTPEEDAGLCWGSCYGKILEKGILASIMKKAKRKKGFLIDNRARE